MTLLITERVFVPLGLLRQIKAHAIEYGDLECCGMIGGVDGRFLALSRCANKASNPKHAFFIDPWHVLRSERAFESRGYKVMAIYHSHPSSLAEPSQADLSLIPDDLISLIYSRPQDSILAWRGTTQVDLEVIR